MDPPSPLLGRLERVPLRHAWASDAQDFTPLLALSENLRLLGETVGMVLEPEAQEQAVGPFRADMLAKNVSDRTWVLIENQLERTDPTNREAWPRQHALLADRIASLYKALAARIERLDRRAGESQSFGLPTADFTPEATIS